MSETAMADCPIRIPGLQMVRESDTAIIFDRDHRRLLALNDTAAAIWELCDGQTSVGEMVEAAGDLFAAPGDKIRIDVEAAVRDLRAAGCLRSRDTNDD